MAESFSFDVVSDFDRQELVNTLDQVKREISQRYDLKGTDTSVVLDINPSLLTVLLPQSLDRQIPEIKDQLERVMHLVEKSENDELPLPLASSLCNQEIITRCDQLICFAFHDSETLLNSCRCAEEMGKVVSLLFFD